MTRHNVEVVAGRPALFLDRDGTVIENFPYLKDPAQVALIPGAREAIARFVAAGYAIVIVTNQSGIARGLCSPTQYQAVESAVIDALLPATVHATYACPFYPDHPWRKPEPGMLLAAGRDLGLVLSKSVMVGDTLADVMAGAAAGVDVVAHVLTGHGESERTAVNAWVAAKPARHFRFLRDLRSIADMAPGRSQ